MQPSSSKASVHLGAAAGVSMHWTLTSSLLPWYEHKVRQSSTQTAAEVREAFVGKKQNDVGSVLLQSVVDLAPVLRGSDVEGWRTIERERGNGSVGCQSFLSRNSSVDGKAQYCDHGRPQRHSEPKRRVAHVRSIQVSVEGARKHQLVKWNNERRTVMFPYDCFLDFSSGLRAAAHLSRTYGYIAAQASLA